MARIKEMAMDIADKRGIEFEEVTDEMIAEELYDRKIIDKTDKSEEEDKV